MPVNFKNSKLWIPFLKKVSAYKVGQTIVIGTFWKESKASYTTTCQFLKLLSNLNYLDRVSPSAYQVIQIIPEDLKYS